MKTRFISLQGFILSITLFLVMYEVRSQDARSTRNSWQASTATDKRSTDVAASDSKFITDSSEITWIQKNGQKIYRFSIERVSGSWTDLKKDGSISWDVSLNNKKGVISISREGGQAVLRLRYRSGEPTALDLEYVIESVETK